MWCEKRGVIVPLAGQSQGEQTQLVSFHLQDPRLGAISEATRQMSENGGNRYDVERRVSVGEAGGWAAGLVRLTEAQDAATRTPQILDDLRANGVLIQGQQRVEAPAGFVREELRIAYQTEQNPLGIGNVLDALKRSPGVELEEGARQQQAREALANAERERQAELRRQQAEQETARQQAERERQANTPEAQRAREEADRQLTSGLLAAAAAQQRQQPGGGMHPMEGLDQIFREKAMEGAGTKAPSYEEVPRSMHTPDASHPVRFVQLEAGSGAENAQRLQESVRQLERAGATPSPLQQEPGSGVQTAMVAYRLDQTELPQIHRLLSETQKEGQLRVNEQPGLSAERLLELERRGQPEVGASKAPAFDLATEQQRSPAVEHPYRYAEINMSAAGHNEDKLRVMRKDFEQAGASVTAVEPHRDLAGREQLRIMVGYRIDQPELPQIQEQLRAAQQADTVLYKERGGQAMERSWELERRQREPGVSLNFAPEAIHPKDPGREAAVAGQQGTGPASVGQQSRDYYPAEGWKTQVLRDRRDDELAPVAAQLVKVGAQVGGTLPDGAGGREMVVSYHPAAVPQDKVLEVIETHRAAREVTGPQQASTPVPGAERAVEAAPAVRTPERANEPAPAPQPAVATTTSVSEQPFRTVGISIVEEGLQQRAQQLRQDLQQQGAIVSELQKRESGQDLSRQHFTASYPLGPQSAGIAQTLETAGRQPGINLEESMTQQRERQRLYGGEVPAISGTTVAAASAYAAGPPHGPGNWRQGVVLVSDTEEERTRSATVREALQKAGAQVGAGGNGATVFPVLPSAIPTKPSRSSWSA
ncbi:hypothetical protein LRS06_21565 [Hymenobacter sp. J193]|uniref:hypothetical protein n=1 Tax=Hymenobacter sp. J193 TaxID=2898429 RepID=UPI002151DE5A|nr:hypothetical protein [Hymenobacter sp. J193]MCR5890318.1 hypothetical protein [Hymenobacter sp. J193]